MKNNDTNDTNDRIPEDENLGSAGSPHSTGRNLHEHSTDFERSEGGVSPAHCDICGASIPPSRAKCPDHQHVQGVDTENGPWSISNVGVTVVAASSKFHALANAAVSFRRRETGGGANSFELIYDFGQPSDTLTSGWGGELPEAVEFDSEAGETLVETAISKTDDDEVKSGGEVGGIEIDPSIIGESTQSDSYLYDERGAVLSSEEDLAQFDTGPENEDYSYWVIPALLYKRDEEVGDESRRTMDCLGCGKSEHVFNGLTNTPDDMERDQMGVWICIECERRRAGEPPAKYDSRRSDEESTSDGGGEKTISEAEEEEFEAAMERLDTEDNVSDSSE